MLPFSTFYLWATPIEETAQTTPYIALIFSTSSNILNVQFYPFFICLLEVFLNKTILNIVLTFYAFDGLNNKQEKKLLHFIIDTFFLLIAWLFSFSLPCHFIQIMYVGSC